MIPKTENPRPLINIPATRGKTSPYSALDCSNLSVLSGAKSKPRPMSTRYDPKYSRLNLVLFMLASQTQAEATTDPFSSWLKRPSSSEAGSYRGDRGWKLGEPRL